MASDLYPYKKIILENHYAICAIYEPHPFRKSALPVGCDFKISDYEWCWDYYDWCGNLIGISDEEPEGKVVPFFTEESVGSKSLADYLNRINPVFVRSWKRSVKKFDGNVYARPASMWFDQVGVDCDTGEPITKFTRCE